MVEEVLQKTGLSREELVELIEDLERLRRLLDKDRLYIQRLAGLVRVTGEADPLECKYVKACMPALLREWDVLRMVIGGLHELVGER